MRGSAWTGRTGGDCVERDRALRDIGGVIADALEIAGDLERGNDLAQIARHRLAQRQQAHRQALELALELVDLGVALDDAGGEIAVALRPPPRSPAASWLSARPPISVIVLLSRRSSSS